MRAATEADVPAIRAFLARHAEIAMFALSNLDLHGLAPAEGSGAHRSLHAWIDGTPVSAFVAITEEGMILPVLPGRIAEPWARVAPCLSGRRAFGITGASSAVRAGFDALGLARAGCALDRDEPHFLLTLDDLVIPDCAGMTLVRPDDRFRGLLIEWRRAYHLEILGTRPGQVDAVAARETREALAADRYRLLMRDGVPVSQAGLNAAAGDIVQVGGVYTPPALRGRGYARRATALMLGERRRAGAARAVLFAASDMAARAYAAIGFRRIGTYTLTVFENPVRIAP